MSLGPLTAVVDGQRNLFPAGYQFYPAGYGPQTTGVPNVSPTMPPFIGAANTATGASAAAGMEGVGGYGTASNNTVVTSIANANGHHWKVSPVWWAVLFLIGGLIVLKTVHWRDTVLEGFEERGSAGPLEERAEEHA